MYVYTRLQYDRMLIAFFRARHLLEHDVIGKSVATNFITSGKWIAVDLRSIEKKKKNDEAMSVRYTQVLYTHINRGSRGISR